METKLLYAMDENANEAIAQAAEILKNGGLVAIPTETVYGLAASAFNSDAVDRIFAAKGRPNDNPLIVHIAEVGALNSLVAEIPAAAKRCMKAFWPGPFTAVLKKSDRIPAAVSGGLNTVAVRMPENAVARAVIRAAGLPLAAPSANLSGSPSPTTAQHVVADLQGRVDAIVVSSDCNVGVESTVVSFACNPPRLLRPGGITVEQLREIVPTLVVDAAVLEEPKPDAQVASPGMKYKHYAPLAQITMATGDRNAFVQYCNRNTQTYALALCFEEDVAGLMLPHLSLGGAQDFGAQAGLLFRRLREIDARGIGSVIAHAPDRCGVGLAVYNRLIRAAGFRVIEL